VAAVIRSTEENGIDYLAFLLQDTIVDNLPPPPGQCGTTQNHKTIRKHNGGNGWLFRMEMLKKHNPKKTAA